MLNVIKGYVSYQGHTVAVFTPYSTLVQTIVARLCIWILRMMWAVQVWIRIASALLYVFCFVDRKCFKSATERVLRNPGRISWLSPRTSSHRTHLSVSLLVSNIHDIGYLGQPIAQNQSIWLNKPSNIAISIPYWIHANYKHCCKYHLWLFSQARKKIIICIWLSVHAYENMHTKLKF